MESKVLPKVSIIIPVYKTEAYIAECLDSVLAQTYQDFEVICVDDGSPDNSVEIIKEYSKNDPRISYVRQENAGLSAARNTGIRNAKGEYILPLDSDDMLEKNCLKYLVEALDKNVADVVTPYIFRFTTDVKDYYQVLSAKPTACNESQSNYACSSSLYKKEFFYRYGGYDESFKWGYEDWEFWLKFIQDGKTIKRIEKAFFFYRTKPDSESMLQTLLKNKEKCQEIRQILDSRYPIVKKYRAWQYVAYKQMVRYTKRYLKYVYIKRIDPINYRYEYTFFYRFKITVPFS